MTIREFLDLPYSIECDIRREQEKIQHYRDAAERCTSHIDGIGGGCGQFGHSAMAHATECIADAEALIEKKKAAYEQATMRLIQVIYSLDREAESQALYCRFLERKTVSATAASMNYTKRYIQWLVNGGLTNAEKWIMEHHPEYLEEENTIDK